MFRELEVGDTPTARIRRVSRDAFRTSSSRKKVFTNGFYKNIRLIAVGKNPELVGNP